MRIVKLSIVLLLCTFSTFTLAAYHKARSRPIPPNKPVGFYLGVGVGMNSLTASHNSVQLDDYYPAAYKTTVNSLFPLVQVGYWGNLRRYSCWMWGFKAFYKYLGVNASYIVNAYGPYNNHDTQVPQETGLLFNLGFKYLKNIFPYFGAGLMWLPKVDDVFYNNTWDFRKQKSMVGGIFELGFLYTLNPRWYLDVVYTFGMTGSRAFDTLNDDADNWSTVKRNVRIISQEVMVSINRRFKF